MEYQSGIDLKIFYQKQIRLKPEAKWMEENMYEVEYSRDEDLSFYLKKNVKHRFMLQKFKEKPESSGSEG